jgi:ankyrin repeat protein
MAVLNNNLDVARVLLDRGANVNADDFWGRSPLWAAVEYRNLDMNNREQDSPKDNGVDRAPILAFIRVLLQSGANVNARTREVPPSRRWLYSLGDVSWVDFTGQTPFLRAALSGDTSTMRLLLEHGADPNVATSAGTTPLMAAAGVNWVVAQTYTESPEALVDAVTLCLELGADLNAANSMGLTALLGAANRGSNDIIELLVARGARLDIKDKEGRTPLRWAEGVFLAAVGAERKPKTIALLEELMARSAPRPSAPPLNRVP